MLLISRHELAEARNRQRWGSDGGPLSPNPQTRAIFIEGGAGVAEIEAATLAAWASVRADMRRHLVAFASEAGRG